MVKLRSPCFPGTLEAIHPSSSTWKHWEGRDSNTYMSLAFRLLGHLPPGLGRKSIGNRIGCRHWGPQDEAGVAHAKAERKWPKVKTISVSFPPLAPTSYQTPPTLTSQNPSQGRACFCCPNSHICQEIWSMFCRDKVFKFNEGGFAMGREVEAPPWSLEEYWKDSCCLLHYIERNRNHYCCWNICPSIHRAWEGILLIQGQPPIGT